MVQHKKPARQSRAHRTKSRERRRLAGGSDGVTGLSLVVGNLFPIPNFSILQNDGRDAAPHRLPPPCSGKNRPKIHPKCNLSSIFARENQQEDTCSSSTKLNVQESNVVMRRTMLSLMSSSLVAAAVATPLSAGAKPMMPMMEEPVLPRFRKTPSGVKIQEVVNGSGPMAKTGDTLEFNFVCRRSNGYFVYSTVDQFNDQSQPAILPLGVGKIIPGLEEVLAGMRLGGKLRALIPPEVGYTDALLEPQPKEFGPRRALMSHAKKPLVFEVQLLKIR